MTVENRAHDQSASNSPIATPPEHLHLTDDENRLQEIWPTFTCPACQSNTDNIRWETTSIPEDMQPHPQHYEGRLPCCFRCGAAATEHTREKHRPEPWKQPILHVIHSIDGLTGNHPATKNIFAEFDSDPDAFLAASTTDLHSITGIGETWADKIHTNRAALYPDHTPPVDGTLYEFRGRRITDVSPQQIAYDLAIQHVSVNDLPHDTEDKTVQEHFSKVASIIENGDVNAGGFRTDDPHIDVNKIINTLR